MGVLLEPTALYHDKDEAAPYAAPDDWRSEREMGRLHWGGRDVLVVTFGNGVGMSRRAAELVAAQFDTVPAAAEGCDALVTTGVMPAGVRL